MKKFSQYLFNYICYAVILVILVIVLSLAFNIGEGDIQSPFLSIVWDILGLHAAFWVSSSLLLSSLMLIYTDIRDDILTKITRISERDERESSIVGHSMKSVFLSSLAMLFLLLLLSSIKITLTERTAELIDDNDNRGQFSIGLMMDVVEKDSIAHEREGYDFYIRYSDLPISKTGVIILLIFWQIGAYQYYSRKYKI